MRKQESILFAIPAQASFYLIKMDSVTSVE